MLTFQRHLTFSDAHAHVRSFPMSAPCGCSDLSGHVAPYVDPVLHIEHGERDALNGDPLPHTVPNSGGGWNGLYTEWPDVYCLCGHPNYLTCEAWPAGGVMGLTVHNVGGHYLTTEADR
jgi:hypothetical protein